MRSLPSSAASGKPLLCCWCDEIAGHAPVWYAGVPHPACARHSAEMSSAQPPLKPIVPAEPCLVQVGGNTLLVAIQDDRGRKSIVVPHGNYWMRRLEEHVKLVPEPATGTVFFLSFGLFPAVLEDYRILPW